MLITKEVLCPEKKCLDGIYLNYFQTYLINSVTSDMFFTEVLSQIPSEYQTFIVGKTLFDYLTAANESYRQYKNYVFLSSESIISSKNYNYLVLKNRKIFNDCLEKIPAASANRIALMDYLLTTIPSLTTVTDLKDNSTVNITSEMRNRLNYIVSIIESNKNILINTVTSYSSMYPSERLA